MSNLQIYEDIASRTNGDVYIGIVGPVRSGKSTFIKKFMEEIVLPTIENENEKARAIDEMPQSASGKTVMTTEPKFIPEKAITVKLDSNICVNVKMIDCVGYVIPGAEGLKENEKERMVNTPWSQSPLPFEAAAEIGTKKVIDEHSTIGILLTSDGTFSEFKRADYEESEKRVLDDLKKSGKPFVVVINSLHPDSDESISLAMDLEKNYNVPVALVNCLELSKGDIEHILELCLFEFPATEIEIEIPSWINSLPSDNPIKSKIENTLFEAAQKVTSIASIHDLTVSLKECDIIKNASTITVDLGTGKSKINLEMYENIFYEILSEQLNEKISNQKDLLELLSKLNNIKNKYEKIKTALESAEKSGYGIVVPSVEDLSLEEPEIIKQSGGYGVKLKASADTIHMIKTKIMTEINPIVGSEKQSEEMIKYLLTEFEENPIKLWESNMFGKTLHCLVNEGLSSKLEHIPNETRTKLGEAIQKIVNDGSNGLICIIL